MRDDGTQTVGGHRLGQEVIGPELDRLDGLVDARLRRGENDLGQREVDARQLQQLDAGHVGKRNLGDDDVHFLLHQDFGGGSAGTGTQHAVVAPERRHHGLARAFVGIDHEDGLAAQ